MFQATVRAWVGCKIWLFQELGALPTNLKWLLVQNFPGRLCLQTASPSTCFPLKADSTKEAWALGPGPNMGNRALARCFPCRIPQTLGQRRPIRSKCTASLSHCSLQENSPCSLGLCLFICITKSTPDPALERMLQEILEGPLVFFHSTWFALPDLSQHVVCSPLSPAVRSLHSGAATCFNRRLTALGGIKPRLQNTSRVI